MFSFRRIGRAWNILTNTRGADKYSWNMHEQIRYLDIEYQAFRKAYKDSQRDLQNNYKEWFPQFARLLHAAEQIEIVFHGEDKALIDNYYNSFELGTGKHCNRDNDPLGKVFAKKDK